MKNILLSGLGGSLFPYLHEKLILSGFNPFYVDSNYELKNIYPELQFIPAPNVTEPTYKDFIINICKQNNIKIYVPLIDEEIITAIAIKSEIGLEVLAPRLLFTELCLDKYKLMKTLAEYNISLNETYKGDEFNWQFGTPIFVKPNIGRGSRGIRKINTKDELNAYYLLENYTPDQVIIQPYINGTEYTVSVLANKKNQLISISPKKIISKKGITISAVTENNEIIEAIAKKINTLLQPQGPFNIQLFITNEGEAIIFEINPRFSTTLVLSYEAGLNEISLLIDNNDNNVTEILKAKENVFIYRRWENCFYVK